MCQIGDAKSVKMVSELDPVAWAGGFVKPWPRCQVPVLCLAGERKKGCIKTWASEWAEGSEGKTEKKLFRPRRPPITPPPRLRPPSLAPLPPLHQRHPSGSLKPLHHAQTFFCCCTRLRRQKKACAHIRRRLQQNPPPSKNHSTGTWLNILLRPPAPSSCPPLLFLFPQV